MCSVTLVSDDDKKTINKRLKKSRSASLTKPFVWLLRAALELSVLYWAYYFIFFYFCQFLRFLNENMDSNIPTDINSPGILWLRHAVFGLSILIYCIKRKRL